MKTLLLLLSVTVTSVSIAQTKAKAGKEITPPLAVTIAFEKEFPGKLAAWTANYGGEDAEELRYEARFNTAITPELAVYDKTGALKAAGAKIPIGELPPPAFNYLKKNYPDKVVEAIKIMEGEVTTFEAGIEREGKPFDIVFDKEGLFVEMIEKF